jgi:hypothetical protein
MGRQREVEVSISVEYTPDTGRQVRALLTILNVSPDEIERIIQTKDEDDEHEKGHQR